MPPLQRGYLKLMPAMFSRLNFHIPSAMDKLGRTHRQEGLRIPQSAGADCREAGSLRRSGSADQLPTPSTVFIASNNGSASTPSARG